MSSYLTSLGHQVIPLVRTAQKGAIVWDWEKRFISSSLENFDAVIHLAGEPLSFSLWGKKKKEAILQSRLKGTAFLVSLLSQVKNPPGVFISASAVGFYGDRGEEILDESSEGGDTFLASVCKAWEGASQILQGRGLRVVKARFGIVLGRGGGALQKMLPIYRKGLGATLGSGRQWMSWISQEDLIGALTFLLESSLEGPVNLVSPRAVRQEVFSHLLAEVLQRPHLFRIPAWVIRLILGEMGRGMLLASAHVVPKQLSSQGFNFSYPDVKEVLENLLT